MLWKKIYTIIWNLEVIFWENMHIYYLKDFLMKNSNSIFMVLCKTNFYLALAFVNGKLKIHSTIWNINFHN